MTLAFSAADAEITRTEVFRHGRRDREERRGRGETPAIFSAIRR
jgi:hypothetical protein